MTTETTQPDDEEQTIECDVSVEPTSVQNTAIDAIRVDVNYTDAHAQFPMRYAGFGLRGVELTEVGVIHAMTRLKLCGVYEDPDGHHTPRFVVANNGEYYINEGECDFRDEYTVVWSRRDEQEGESDD